MTTITDAPAGFMLTDDQQNALDAFNLFLMDPEAPVFVLSGYSGCGKSTLVRTIIDRVPNVLKAARLISPDQPEYAIELTATTNKAAENLAQITGEAVRTIHSSLGLRLNVNHETDTTTLEPSTSDKKRNVLLFIDEASYIDSQLLGFIFQLTDKCKIVFIGDPAQLTPVKASGVPVFDAGFPGAALTTVVRQAEGNPIVELSTKFRHTVNTGEFFSFKPDGAAIQYLDHDTFKAEIVKEFTRKDWRYRDSKILMWTNKATIAANKFVRAHVKGTPDFAEGDYAVCNSYITINRKGIKTDQMVQITEISAPYERYGVTGNDFTIDYTGTAFMPHSLQAKAAAIKQARDDQNFQWVREMESEWIDLRAAYACTINKSQGSTYDAVFIDLDDVRRCNSGDQIARMMYVAVSRARHRVYLTGDLA